MKILRTPDERFAALPGYAFAPHYVDVPSGAGPRLRLHYVDEGPRDGPAVLLLHGEPSWSYLYRKMVPILVDHGFRALAPDLVGFGRSDKPAAIEDYTYRRHIDWTTAWFEALNLSGVTLMCQDWGGLIGLRMVAAMPDRFARVVTANTGLPTGQGASPAFLNWLNFSQTVPVLPIGQIMAGGMKSPPPPEVIAAYEAPYPEESYKAGARRFPALVPVTPEHPEAEPNRAAWGVLEGFTRPWLTAFSDSDPITRGGDLVFQARVPGAKGQPHVTIKDAGHFLQEDKGPELAEIIIGFIQKTS